ncbi:peptidoglycan endopeptidase [bacterium]|nr:MAG: peptidoglycan endopeptidase [bacterium]
MRRVFLFALTALAAVASAEKVVVGRLGRAKTAAQIYAAPSAKAKVLSRVKAGVNLVVKKEGSNWLTVVMTDHRLAYIPAQTVEVLPYEYVEDRSQAVVKQTRNTRSTYVASRGGVPRGTTDARYQLAEYAQKFEGTTPYKWGGNEIGSGIDCSGFVKKMYGAIGVSLPRTAAEQARVGMKITRYEDLRPGDRLYFWDAKRGKIGHTGIYVGGGYFTHSSSGHNGIAKDFLSARWQKICVDARR